MEILIDWVMKVAIVLVSGAIGYLVAKLEKLSSRIDKHAEEFHMKHSSLRERVVKIEATALTEDKARAIIKEQIDPISEDIRNIRTTVNSINLTLASIPKRRNDP